MSMIEVFGAGALDRRITIRTMSDHQDDVYGGVTESPATLASVWAEVTYLRGRELFEAQQISPEVTTRFRVRWRSDVTPKHEILYGSTRYDIFHVAELGRQSGLEILAAARNE